VPGSRLGELQVYADGPSRVLEGPRIWLGVDGDLTVERHDDRGAFPRADVLVPAALRDGMAWTADPYGRDPARAAAAPLATPPPG